MGLSPRVADVAPGAWQEDVLALLDRLQIHSAHFCGVSLGALIGMRLAIDEPQRVRSLTLDSPTLNLVALPKEIGTEAVNGPPPWVIAELLAMHGDDWQTVVRNCDTYLEFRSWN